MCVPSEKIVKQDAERRNYDIVVIGEESHVAYNRVGLSSFFEHRKIEDLYLNPKEWVSSPDIPSCWIDYLNPVSMDLSRTVRSITTSIPE